VLYCLSQTASQFFSGYFGDGGLSAPHLSVHFWKKVFLFVYDSYTGHFIMTFLELM
jgi:hypothetical protein